VKKTIRTSIRWNNVATTIAGAMTIALYIAAMSKPLAELGTEFTEAARVTIIHTLGGRA
jgi:hypothetical protein